LELGSNTKLVFTQKTVNKT